MVLQIHISNFTQFQIMIFLMQIVSGIIT